MATVASSHSHIEEKGSKSPASPGHGQPNTFTWEGISFSVKRKGKQITLLDGISGSIQGGQMLAVMGSSGGGKTTLLDCLAGRKVATSGTMTFNGSSDFNMQAVSSYVEQDDALLGVLTVQETLAFTTKLAFPNLSKDELDSRVKDTIDGLGLSHVAGNIIGTPIQRGISGGQKRRVSIGNGLVMRPKILLLDEPTSGLDTNTAYEVLLKIRSLAQTHNIAVVCTIHSPNWETFSLFEKVLLLARGKTMYFGAVSELTPYMASLGHPCPTHSNPADHAIMLISTDFQNTDERSARDELHAAETGAVVARGNLEQLADAYRRYAEEHAHAMALSGQHDPVHPSDGILVSHGSRSKAVSSGIKSILAQTMTLTQRNLLNYRRNILAYGIRLGMYIGMGVMMAAVWTHLPQIDSRINDRLSVSFFSVAFLGFMSVAGIPAFLEERSVMLRERRNRLYTAAPYALANTAATTPFLFLCSVFFAVVVYWAIGLRPGAAPFFRFLSFLFLGVYAAEAQALLIAAILPLFVAALAISAFANGFMMSVQGYFLRNIPDFWKYSAHYADYQTYAFQLLVKNDLTSLTFGCVGDVAAGTCQCSFPSSLIPQGQCAVTGEDVIKSLHFANLSATESAFILVGIIVLYRLAFWAVLARSK
ncbi:hypothetical protein OC835_001134 [Tilletia horrida]|nr:hypothetical protein OC835_001134 [Tilletia horrida]